MCIINNTKKFIFIHVPKCAGTTITKYYSSFSTCRDVEIGGTRVGEILQPHFQKRYGLNKHSTINEIDLALGQGVIDEFFTFGFVRNPYERVISSFTFLRKWEGWGEYEHFRTIKDVNEFIQSHYFQGEGVDRQLEPQSFWLGDGLAATGKSVNYIGKVEEIMESVQHINNRIGLDLQSIDILHKNSSRNADINRDINLCLSKNSIEIINRRYENDFVFYGYAMI